MAEEDLSLLNVQGFEFRVLFFSFYPKTLNPKPRTLNPEPETLNNAVNNQTA